MKVLLLCCWPIWLWAQSSTATGVVQGTTNDSSGAPVPGVRISVKNQDTGSERSAQSDGAGRYSLSALPIGTYTMRLEAKGFASVEVKPFLLSIGQAIRQDFELQPAGISERVEVKEEPEGIDVTAATAGVAMGYERIEEAPARSRNYLNFVLAAPGVAPSAGTSSQRTMTGTRTTLGDSGFTFGGMRPRNNAIQIDGLDNRDETTGGNRVAVGLEMVQEFRVSGTSIGAELGGAAGGLLNMVTRSGVNIWHGDLTFFAQNEVSNARRPEVSTQQRPRFRRYQPGVSANGPWQRDRSFVSGAVEYEHESAEEWSNVPEEAAAILNRALASPLYARSNQRVLRGLYPTSTRGTELSLKVNHQAGEKDTLSARYAFSRGRVRGEVQGPDNLADQSAQGNSRSTDHSLVGNWMRLFSPRVVNEFRFQTAERTMELSPNGGGPMLEIPGVATLGQFYRMDARRRERHYQLVENLNVVWGGHRLSTGVDWHAVTLDADLRNRFAGMYVFPTLADFVQGRPDVFIQAFGVSRTSPSTYPVGLWVQDRWDLKPGLHLELGARFDRQRMPAGITASSTNLAPRAGLAWRPFGKRPLVLRAGFGLFFDRYPLAFLNDALQKNGVQGFEQYAVGAQAIGALERSRGAILESALDGVSRARYRSSAQFPSTYGRKLSAGMEYGLGKDTSITIEASQIRGVHLPRVRNVRGSLPPDYELEQTARSAHWGASVFLNRRMSQDFTYLIAYNTGRTRDDGSDFDEHPLNPLAIRQDWSWSRQHQAHRLAASAIFELPWEDWSWVPGWLKEASEDLSFAPILSVGSGRPVNPLFTTDLLRTGAYPISARPAQMARNSFLSPATGSLDLRVMKTLKVLQERAVLQFGVESFNLTNHANVERVSPYYASPAGRLGNFRQILESLPGRQLQFLMQFEY